MQKTLSLSFSFLSNDVLDRLEDTWTYYLPTAKLKTVKTSVMIPGIITEVRPTKAEEKTQ